MHLDHRDATALAGDLYRGWSDEKRVRTTAMTLPRRGAAWEAEPVAPDEHAAIYASIQPHLEADNDAAPASGPVHWGNLKAVGFWAVTVRANWRVIFRFEDGDAFDVDYLDYH